MLLLEQVAREITTDPSEKFINTEIRLRNPAGEWRWMKLWLSAFRRASDSRVEQYMGIAQDVTEQRQTQTQALRLALEEERVRVLTDFIQAASHEFRTPLSSINTSLYMLERLIDNESASRYLSRIEAGADQILMLVEALLHLSELDGIQQLELTPLQVTTLAEHVIERYDPVAAERNITLTRHAEDHLPDAAINARQFTSALAHLVDNAIRYTPDDGTVEIRVTADHTSVQIAIIDNGIGMSPEVQSQIFQRFFRMDTARSTRGLGLGLPSVEKIVQLHGGTISVESTPGEGSTFTITLPALTPQTENAFSNLDTRM
jgi:signal transduction histidine kinase